MFLLLVKVYCGCICDPLFVDYSCMTVEDAGLAAYWLVLRTEALDFDDSPRRLSVALF